MFRVREPGTDPQRLESRKPALQNTATCPQRLMQGFVGVDPLFPEPCAEVAIENRRLDDEREWPRARQLFQSLEVAGAAIRFERFEKGPEVVVEIAVALLLRDLAGFGHRKDAWLFPNGGGNRFTPGTV